MRIGDWSSDVCSSYLDARNIGLPPPRFKQNRTWPLKKRPKAIDAARAGGIRRAIALEVTMHRLFVALEPPAAVRHQLLDLMGGIANARWKTEAQLHLTLRLIGEVARHRADDGAAEIGGLHHPRLEIETVGNRQSIVTGKSVFVSVD